MKTAFDGFISRLHIDFGVGKYFLRKWKTNNKRNTDSMDFIKIKHFFSKWHHLKDEL